MTDDQRNEIELLRKNGGSIKEIIEWTGCSKDAVRSLVRRLELQSIQEDPGLFGRIRDGKACRFCGSNLNQPHTGRTRKFCCESCRRAFWRINPELAEHKTSSTYIKICPYCHKTFEVYGNRKRKYCCHEHYVLDRFGPEKTRNYKED